MVEPPVLRYGTDPAKYMLSAHTPDFTDQQSVMQLGTGCLISDLPFNKSL